MLHLCKREQCAVQRSLHLKSVLHPVPRAPRTAPQASRPRFPLTASAWRSLGPSSFPVLTPPPLVGVSGVAAGFLRPTRLQVRAPARVRGHGRPYGHGAPLHGLGARAVPTQPLPLLPRPSRTDVRLPGRTPLIVPSACTL